MKAQIFKHWHRIRSSFWFLPSLMTCAAVGGAFGAVSLDSFTGDWIAPPSNSMFRIGADGASAVLGVIAGSMITIAGVVVSMTLVALSLASSQLGPRLLRNFMRDAATQVVLGAFTATFLYCLIVLLAIRRAGDAPFVPQISVVLGVLLAVGNIGVFIYFIHHVSVSIQANEVVARVGDELLEELDKLYPEHIGQAPSSATEPPQASWLEDFGRSASPVNATSRGYVQFIDADALLALAVDKNAVIRVERKPGQYVVADRPLAMVLPGDVVDDRFIERVNAAFALGNQRTTGQDVEFAVTQLVEIAVRALSPGLNDPFTAVTCVDHLGSALSRLATRAFPSPYRHDQHGELRVLARSISFPELTDTAFHQIRQNSQACPAVTIRLLETIEVIATVARRPDDLAALMQHAEMIARAAREALPEPRDRQDIDDHLRAVAKACSAKA